MNFIIIVTDSPLFSFFFTEDVNGSFEICILQRKIHLLKCCAHFLLKGFCGEQKSH